MISRRAFFTRRKQEASIRPPWALEQGFEQVCSTCKQCISACPEGVLIEDSNGYPVINFQLGGCTFCEQCLQACQEQALRKREHAWSHRLLVADTCLAKQGISCRSCVDYCEYDAFVVRLKLKGKINLFIDHDECSRCGECISVCPQKAIQRAPDCQRV